MSVLKRRRTETLFLILYAYWWIWMINHLFFQPITAGPVCDFSPIFFGIFTIALSAVYVLVFLIMYFNEKTPFRNEYLFCIGIVSFPLLVTGFYLMAD